MKGTNSLILNRATLCEAVQMWLASQFKGPPPVVANIAFLSRGSGEFEVTLGEPVSEDEAND